MRAVLLCSVTDIDWEQYIEWKDKNGKELYEGDIIKVTTKYYGKEKHKIKVLEWNDDIKNDSFGEPFTMGYEIEGHRQHSRKPRIARKY